MAEVSSETCLPLSTKEDSKKIVEPGVVNQTELFHECKVLISIVMSIILMSTKTN